MMRWSQTCFNHEKKHEKIKFQIEIINKMGIGSCKIVFYRTGVGKYACKLYSLANKCIFYC